MGLGSVYGLVGLEGKTKVGIILLVFKLFMYVGLCIYIYIYIYTHTYTHVFHVLLFI